MPDHAEGASAAPLAAAESPAVIAHLNMLQAVVTRLAGNSAQCKTWCVAIVSALFGFAGATRSGRIAAAAIIPIAFSASSTPPISRTNVPIATCTPRPP